MTLPPLEDVDQLHDALRVRERLRRPIGADGRAQGDLRQVKASVLDVAEDTLARGAEIPHGARRHGPQDLRGSRAEAVTVFHLVGARAETHVPGEPHEPGHGPAAPRRVAAALLLAADVHLGTKDQPSPVDREVARYERALVRVRGVALRSVHPR